jgi:hypothetical protein
MLNSLKILSTLARAPNLRKIKVLHLGRPPHSEWSVFLNPFVES